MEYLRFKNDPSRKEIGGASRNQIIDAFRGIAILSVIAFHYADVNVGRFGVHIFFVISGLVISMTILKTKAVADFVIRRFARLFPPLAVCSLITFVLVSKLNVLDYIANLTFFPKVLGFPYVDGSYWTLHIEIEFYALVAAAYFLLGQRFWAGVAAAACLGLFGKYMAFFLIGMGTYFWIFEKDKLGTIVTSSIGLIAYVLYGIHLQLTENIYMVGCIVTLVAALKFIPQFKFEPLAYIGRVSYPLYLLHQGIGFTVITAVEKAGWPKAAAIAAASAACLCLAIVVHYTVEGPMKGIIISFWRQRRAGKLAVAE